MKLAVMQPYFFPYLGYFQLIHAVDKFVLYDKVAFIKKAWMNRNKIMVKNQDPAYITVPLDKKSSKKNIEDIMIVPNTDWQDKTLNLIYHNYKKAPFFEEIYPRLENIIRAEHDTLSSLNKDSIFMIAKELNINTELSAYPTYGDMEKKLHDHDMMAHYPGIQLETPERKVVRVFEIAKEERADTYINPIGGEKLYGKKDFQNNGLQLSFLKMEDIQYPQFSKEFQPLLSIIDVLMHKGWAGTTKLLDEYRLV